MTPSIPSIMEEDLYVIEILIWNNIITGRNQSGQFGIGQEIYIIYLTMMKANSLELHPISFSTRVVDRFAVVIVLLQDQLLIPLSKYYPYCRTPAIVDVENVNNFEKFVKSIQIIKWIYIFELKTLTLEVQPSDIKRVSKLNPFFKLDSALFNYFATVHLTAGINETLLVCQESNSETCSGYKDIESYREIRHRKRSEMYPSDRYIMLLDEIVGVKFIYCYKEVNLSFQLYVEPFQFELWVALLATVLILSFVCESYVRIIENHSFDSVFFLISTLFEEPYSIPNVLWNDTVFRVGLIWWILLSMIFTQGYIGLAINKLSLPLKSMTKFDEFKDISKPICYNKEVCPVEQIMTYEEYFVHYTTSSNYSMLLFNRSIFQSTGNFKLISRLVSNPMSYWDCFFGYRFGSFFEHGTFFAFSKLNRSEKLTATDKLYLGFINLAQQAPPFENDKNTPPEALIEKELNKCDRRNALVDYSDKIQRDYEYYRNYYPEKDFKIGKEQLEVVNFGWEVEKGPSENRLSVAWRIKIGVESGILQTLQNWDKSNDLKKLDKQRLRNEICEGNCGRVIPLDIGGSIQTIFMIWGGMLAAAILFYAMEPLAFITRRV